MSCVFVSVVLFSLSLGCSTQEPAQGSAPPDVEPAQPNPPLTDAERIAQTERLLETARKDLAEIEKSFTDPKSDYAKAETAFKPLDKKVNEEKKAIAKLRDANKLDEAMKAEAALKPLLTEWEQARDRFDLAIAQRKALQAKKVALTEQIAKYEQALAGLKQPADPKQPAAKNDPQPKPPDAKDPAPPTTPPVAKENPPPKPTDDAEIRNARTFAEGRRAALAEAEEKAKSVEDRARVLEQLIATEQRLMAAERKVAEQAEKEVEQLTQKLPTATPAELPNLMAKLAESQQRFAAARTRIAALTDRVASLNNDLRTVQTERIDALQLIDAKRKEAEAADKEVSRLENPLALRNIYKWLLTHGINMVLIVVGVLALHLLVRVSSKRIVRFIARSSNRGSEGDRENRANTLVGVFRYVAAVVLFGGGIIMLLDEAGVPVVPLMGGAAVVGLAIAFGAQNLIKDYFSGFMILLEDQYGVNDVVKIGAISGLVEKITLRVTVLRDLEGVLHFIPHGQVNAVSNMTHGWSRAMFDVPVPHDANLVFVMEELTRLGRELRADPVFATKILEDPEMLGVETLDATAAVVRFLVKTRPLQQWAVKRELLRRIKLRLDELGIGLPPPRQTFEVVPLGNGTNGNGTSHEPEHRLWTGEAKPGR